MTTSKQINEEFQKRIDYDFVKRAMPGIAFYAFAWPVLFFSTGFQKEAPVFCWVMAACFAAFSLFRYAMSLVTKKFYQKSPQLWRIGQAFGTIGHASLWSFLFFMVNHDPAFSSLTTSFNILTAGIASASVMSLIPKYRLTQFYTSIIVLPTGIYSLFSTELLHLGLIVLFFWFYLMYQSLRIFSEYTRAFKIEWSLQEKQEELKGISQTDFLTKTYNRLFFNECIAQQWFLAQRNRKEIALLMIDLDLFKAINDQHGHLFGDECLIQTANVIRHIAKRRSDMVVRYGGEEFAVVLPQTDIASAVKIAERIRESLSSEPFEHDNIKQTITASIGVCAMLPIGNDYKLLLQQADAALYQAKKNGRNRVEISELNHVEDIP